MPHLVALIKKYSMVVKKKLMSKVVVFAFVFFLEALITLRERCEGHQFEREKKTKISSTSNC